MIKILNFYKKVIESYYEIYLNNKNVTYKYKK